MPPISLSRRIHEAFVHGATLALMGNTSAESVTIRVSESSLVAGLLDRPANARCCFVFAHGAGAGMHHVSMASVAGDLSQQGIATLRYQFPYMERGSRRPDPPPLCHATVRAAVAEAARALPGLPLVAGGRSFGGRMTSQAQALAPLPGVAGLAFLAFPLHPAGRPSQERAEHLSAIEIPMLFLQGTRDELATLELLEPVVQRLGARATLKLLQEADHSFHVRVSSGRRDPDVRQELVRALVDWIDGLHS
jgi:predicted alpha/beta-hydrolase family hydrolase